MGEKGHQQHGVKAAKATLIHLRPVFPPIADYEKKQGHTQGKVIKSHL
jgi:hypothetical protein